MRKSKINFQEIIDAIFKNLLFKIELQNSAWTGSWTRK